MQQLIDYIFQQYSGYQQVDVWLEIIAVIFGFLSVWYSKQNKILVFPTGMISTAIFVYLLYNWGLLGDMLINAYYFVMSVYGWFIWSRRVDAAHFTPISQINAGERKKSVYLFFGTIVFVFLVYYQQGKWNSWTAYVDTFTTAVFFVGMWLMAKRKLENWVFWIVGDVISVPLYLYKGLAFTSLQYLVFTIIAIYGYLSWKKILNNIPQT